MSELTSNESVEIFSMIQSPLCRPVILNLEAKGVQRGLLDLMVLKHSVALAVELAKMDSSERAARPYGVETGCHTFWRLQFSSSERAARPYGVETAIRDTYSQVTGRGFREGCYDLMVLNDCLGRVCVPLMGLVVGLCR